MKIQGFDNNYNNLRFTGFFKTKDKSGGEDKKKYDNFLFIDTHLLDYGTPKKVALVRDDKYTFTTVMLYNDRDRCYLREEMSDEEAEAAAIMFEANGVKKDDIIRLVDIKGGQYGVIKKPVPAENPKPNKSTIDIDSLSTKERAAVLKALYQVKQREQEAKTYLRSPAILNSSSTKRTMSYPAFLARTYESGFYIGAVLDNLNISARGGFEPENIDTVSVSEDGTQMRIQTKDGKRANLNFKDGSRFVYDSAIDDSGYGTLMIMDKNGPVLKY